MPCIDKRAASRVLLLNQRVKISGVDGAPRQSPATLSEVSAHTSRPLTAQIKSPTRTTPLSSAALPGSMRVTPNGPVSTPNCRANFMPTKPSLARMIETVRVASPFTSTAAVPEAAEVIQLQMALYMSSICVYVYVHIYITKCTYTIMHTYVYPKQV